MLTNCAFQLLFGKIYSYYSTKWVFLISLGIFELGSLVCGAAPSSIALILGRAVAGLGGSGVTTGAFLIISQVVPLEKRPVYTSAVTSVFAVSSVLGPMYVPVFALFFTIAGSSTFVPVKRQANLMIDWAVSSPITSRGVGASISIFLSEVSRLCSCFSW